MNPLRELVRDEHALIGEIIADGFADDPVNLWALNNVEAMRPVYTLMARHLYLPRGFGHCHREGTAGSLWLPPGVKKHIGVWPTLQMAGPIVRHGGWRGVRNSMAIDALMRSRQPEEPHYYLFAIAVRPAHQGQGLGGALMREALARIDAERQPAYLENSKAQNIGFYQRHGFELIEELRAARDSPPLFLMWRPAR